MSAIGRAQLPEFLLPYLGSQSLNVISARYRGVTLTGVAFRTKANTSARDRAQSKPRCLSGSSATSIESVLELNSAEWQSPLPEPRKLGSVAEAEELANDVRAQWKLGNDPIPNMTELLEERG